jgi:hypothetical protein
VAAIARRLTQAMAAANSRNYPSTMDILTLLGKGKSIELPLEQLISFLKDQWPLINPRHEKPNSRNRTELPENRTELPEPIGFGS